MLFALASNNAGGGGKNIAWLSFKTKDIAGSYC